MIIGVNEILFVKPVIHSADARSFRGGELSDRFSGNRIFLKMCSPRENVPEITFTIPPPPLPLLFPFEKEEGETY